MSKDLELAADELGRVKELDLRAWEKCVRLLDEASEHMSQVLADHAKDRWKGVYRIRAKLGYDVMVDGVPLGMDLAYNAASNLCDLIEQGRGDKKRVVPGTSIQLSLTLPSQQEIGEMQVATNLARAFATFLTQNREVIRARGFTPAELSDESDETREEYQERLDELLAEWSNLHKETL